MRNKLAILTLLILFIVSISCVSAEDSNSVSVLSDSNSDVYVSPTGNDNNVVMLIILLLQLIKQ